VRFTPLGLDFALLVRLLRSIRPPWHNLLLRLMSSDFVFLRAAESYACEVKRLLIEHESSFRVWCLPSWLILPLSSEAKLDILGTIVLISISEPRVTIGLVRRREITFAVASLTEQIARSATTMGRTSYQVDGTAASNG
jgi:hypothetical protein